jgi:hypothetical protein
MYDLERLQVDLVCENLTEDQYPQLEEQIFLFLLEKYNFKH